VQGACRYDLVHQDTPATKLPQTQSPCVSTTSKHALSDTANIIVLLQEALKWMYAIILQ